MRLLEVVRGKRTSKQTLLTALALSKGMGKIAVVGFIVNRIGQIYRRECELMLEEGCLPHEIDSAMRAFGFARRPFEVADLAGLDVSWARRRRLAATRLADERYVCIADRLCEDGHFGQKTASGWYRYDTCGRTPIRNPVFEALIVEESVAKGIARRAFKQEEIQRRALSAMVNEACLVLDAGIAARASDIDVAIVNGLGFPRSWGGPLSWAARQPAAVTERGQDEIAKAAGHRHVRAAGLPRIIDASGSAV